MPDYIFLQCYNTDGFTIGEESETSTALLPKVYAAMNTLVSIEYDATSAPNSIANVPDIKIAIGFPSNAGAGNADTIFCPNVNAIGIPCITSSGGPSYDQTTILNELAGQIKELYWGSVNNKSNVCGIMT